MFVADSFAEDLALASRCILLKCGMNPGVRESRGPMSERVLTRAARRGKLTNRQTVWRLAVRVRAR